MSLWLVWTGLITVLGAMVLEVGGLGERVLRGMLEGEVDTLADAAEEARASEASWELLAKA